MKSVLEPDTIAEGEHPWGRIDVSPAGPTTGTSLKLTIYPPGTTATARRLLRIQRDWPVVAGAVVMLSALAVSSWSLTAAVALIALYIVGIVVTTRLTGSIRAQCHRLEVVTMTEADARSAEGVAGRFTKARAELESLESRLEHGELTPAAFEAGWRRVYRSVGALDS